MVEAAARGGGFHVFDKFVPAISGVNLPLMVAKLSLGKKLVNFHIKKNKAILKFFPSKKGIVKSISGFNILQNYKNVDGDSFVNVQEEVSDASNDGDRLGYILVWGNNLIILKNLIKKLFYNIKFVVK